MTHVTNLGRRTARFGRRGSFYPQLFFMAAMLSTYRRYTIDYSLMDSNAGKLQRIPLPFCRRRHQSRGVAQLNFGTAVAYILSPSCWPLPYSHKEGIQSTTA